MLEVDPSCTSPSTSSACPCLSEKMIDSTLVLPVVSAVVLEYQTLLHQYHHILSDE